MEDEALTEKIIGCAMQVHRVLGAGYLEIVCRNALDHELRRAGLHAECEKPLGVTYDGVNVGNYVADIIVEGKVILELKAVLSLSPVHEAQLVNYLSATGIEIGLLLNFGADRLGFRRKHRTYRPKKIGQDEPDARLQELPPHDARSGDQ
jgi:GxxExxY protein